MRSACCSLVFLLVTSAHSSLAQSHFWIFFRDRGQTFVSRDLAPQLGISQRALWRRSKVLPPEKLIDERDLPVSPLFIKQVRATGAKILTTSRWLNAVSVDATPKQLEAVRSLPEVSSINFVAALRHAPEQISPAPSTPILAKTYGSVLLDYGLSTAQLANIKVINVHNLGINGARTIVGMIDNGFNNHRTHNALKNIRVLDEYDFIHRIGTTEHQSWESSGQGWHGAATLSALGGYAPGTLVGAAFGASFILAKTEMDSTEVPAEEDLYVEALEWMEQRGADVVSTSLGYDDFDPVGKYNPGDILYSMKNGHTAIISIAASTAANKGVLLVTAMGNEGPWLSDPSLSSDSLYRPVSGTTGSLITPADADSIIAVGASYSDGVRADFSSTGPTFDGRIKPEVMAQGVSVIAADATSNSGYASVSGTSLATPLVAGAAALIFSAHPELTPMQVRAALINTATPVQDPFAPSRTSQYPNNFYGYGVINAKKALLSLGIAMSNEPQVTLTDTTMTISVFVESDTTLIADSLRLYYRVSPGAPFLELRLSPTASPQLLSATIPVSQDSLYPQGFLTASDARGRSQTVPYGAPDSLFVFRQYRTIGGPALLSQSFVLNTNFPNPFNGGTSITFDGSRADQVELFIYDILGRKIRTVYKGLSVPGRNTFHWDGVDEGGHFVSSGIYFCQLRTSNAILTNKMILLR